MDRQQDPTANSQNPGGTGRRRRRRRRKGGGEGGSGGGGGGGGRPPGAQTSSSSNPQGGAGAGAGNTKRRRRRPGSGQRRIDPFQIFAAYHLGLDENNHYRKLGAREVARRFNIQPNDVRDLLSRYLIDRDTFYRIRFDIGLYELDIRVAPEGIDKGEVARQIWGEYIEAAQKAGLFETYPSFDDEDEEDEHDEHDDEHDEDGDPDDHDEDGEDDGDDSDGDEEE